MKREELLYMGHPAQKYHAETHVLADGRGAGMRLVDIDNGKGIHLTLCPDRCLDITRLSFKGDNFGYFSPSGYVAPAYYDDRDIGFLRSFTAGFLTTCGLRNAGNPSETDGEIFGLHGRIGHTPAESWSLHIDEVDEGDDVISVEGCMREARLGGEKLSLHRKVEVFTGENRIRLQDTVKNDGTVDEPVMLLYHFNMGYPLLSENALLSLDAVETRPRNDHAASGLENFLKMEKPTKDFEEMCFYHILKTDERGMRQATLFNPMLGKGVRLSFDLPRFVQWKMMGQREYVLGLEPSNCTIDGRKNAIERKELDILAPGEKICYTIELTMLDGKM